jgi:hypothetical protein
MGINIVLLIARQVCRLPRPAAARRPRPPGFRLHVVVAGLACGVVFTSSGGCGRRSGPPVQFVQGKILLDGLPIEGATVDFSPVDGGGLAAYGRTKADGVFNLTSVRGGAIGKGAVVGDYVVSVRKMKVVTEADVGKEISRKEFDAQVRENKDVVGYQPEVPVVPLAYHDAKTSGLRATVKKGRNVGPEFQFELRTDKELRAR